MKNSYKSKQHYFYILKKNNRYAKSNDTLSPRLGGMNDLEQKRMKWNGKEWRK